MLTEVDDSFMIVTFIFGFHLDIWSTSIHCILQKKKPYINKLRIIQLSEADFISALKNITGRRTLYHGEARGINSDQIHEPMPGRITHSTLSII